MPNPLSTSWELFPFRFIDLEEVMRDALVKQCATRCECEVEDVARWAASRGLSTVVIYDERFTPEFGYVLVPVCVRCLAKIVRRKS